MSMGWSWLVIAPERLYASLGLAPGTGAGPWIILGLEGVAFLCGFLKVGFGLGTGVVCTTLAALLLPAKPAVGLLAPLMLVSELASVGTYWGRWDSRRLLWLLPTALLGTWAGSVLLSHLPAAVLRRVIGTVALLYATLYRRRRAVAVRAGLERGAAVVAGLAAGILSGLSHAGGIVLAMYFLWHDLGKEAFLASFAGTLLFQNVLKLGLYWRQGLLDANLILLSLALSPFVVAGGLVGHQASRRVHPRNFRYTLCGLLAGCGVYLLL